MKEQPISYPRLLPRNLPGFDIEAAVARMMGRVDLWWQVLAVFHVRFADWRDAWRQTQAQADREGERKCVHALRMPIRVSARRNDTAYVTSVA